MYLFLLGQLIKYVNAVMVNNYEKLSKVFFPLAVND